MFLLITFFSLLKNQTFVILKMITLSAIMAPTYLWFGVTLSLIWSTFFSGWKSVYLRLTQGSFSLWCVGKRVSLNSNLKVGSVNTKELDGVELMGININKALNSRKHIESLCYPAQYKVLSYCIILKIKVILFT